MKTSQIHLITAMLISSVTGKLESSTVAVHGFGMVDEASKSCCSFKKYIIGSVISDLLNSEANTGITSKEVALCGFEVFRLVKVA